MEEFLGYLGLFEPKSDFAEDHGGHMVAHSVSPAYKGKTHSTINRSNTFSGDPIQP